MKISFIFTILILSLVKYGYGQTVEGRKDNFHLGAIIGINQIKSANLDILMGKKINLRSNSVEANLGYSYFQSFTNYNVIKDIRYNSHGLFAEGNYFLNSLFYTGIRLNLNMNWVDKDSQRKFDAINEINSPTFFTGVATFVQLGAHHSFTSKISFRIQGQLGINNFKIAQDAVYFSNSSSRIRDAQLGIEHRSDFPRLGVESSTPFYCSTPLQS